MNIRVMFMAVVLALLRVVFTSSNDPSSPIQIVFRLTSLVVVPTCPSQRIPAGHLPQIAVLGVSTSQMTCYWRVCDSPLLSSVGDWPYAEGNTSFSSYRTQLFDLNIPPASGIAKDTAGVTAVT